MSKSSKFYIFSQNISFHLRSKGWFIQLTLIINILIILRIQYCGDNLLNKIYYLYLIRNIIIVSNIDHDIFVQAKMCQCTYFYELYYYTTLNVFTNRTGLKTFLITTGVWMFWEAPPDYSSSHTGCSAKMFSNPLVISKLRIYSNCE